MKEILNTTKDHLRGKARDITLFTWGLQMTTIPLIISTTRQYFVADRLEADQVFHETTSQVKTTSALTDPPWMTQIADPLIVMVLHHTATVTSINQANIKIFRVVSEEAEEEEEAEADFNKAVTLCEIVARALALTLHKIDISFFNFNLQFPFLLLKK